jgi:hypothetical protein
MKGIDLYRMCQVEISAAHKVRKIYNINRLELWLLVAIIGTLGLYGKRVMNEYDLLCAIIGHPKQRAKMYGYLAGLKRNRFVCQFDYSGKGRGNYSSIGVTVLGMKVAKQFDIEIENVARHRQKVETYSIEGIELQDGETPSSRYRRLE